MKNADSKGKLQPYLKARSSGICSFNSSPKGSDMPYSLPTAAPYAQRLAPVTIQTPSPGSRLPCRPSSFVKRPGSLLLHTLLVSLQGQRAKQRGRVSCSHTRSTAHSSSGFQTQSFPDVISQSETETSCLGHRGKFVKKRIILKPLFIFQST